MLLPICCLTAGIVKNSLMLQRDRVTPSDKCTSCTEIHFPVNEKFKSTASVRLMMEPVSNDNNSCSVLNQSLSNVGNGCNAQCQQPIVDVQLIQYYSMYYTDTSQTTINRTQQVCLFFHIINCSVSTVQLYSLVGLSCTNAG